MSTSGELAKLSDIKTRIDTANSAIREQEVKKQVAEAEKAALLEKLTTKFGVSSAEEAVALVSKMRGDIKAQKEELEARLLRVEEQLGLK